MVSLALFTPSDINILADQSFTTAAQFNGQQGNFNAPPQTGSPAGFAGSPMGYNGPQSAGGFGRGQQPPQAQWSQATPPGQNFNNGFSGYQS